MITDKELRDIVDNTKELRVKGRASIIKLALGEQRQTAQEIINEC